MVTLQFLSHSELFRVIVITAQWELHPPETPPTQPVTLDSFYHSSALTEDYHCPACFPGLKLPHGRPPEVNPHPQHSL